MRPGQLLFLVFVVTPVVEIALFVTVGSRIGLGATIAVVLVTAFIGAALVSRQGRGQMSRVQEAAAAGTFPGKELAHGAMILVAGALLVTPGFLTDAVGFSLLVPRLREVLRRWLARRYGRGAFTIG
ncbi:MAG: FxsA family protein [Acidimicrobiia bacterium]